MTALLDYPQLGTTLGISVAAAGAWPAARVWTDRCGRCGQPDVGAPSPGRHVPANPPQVAQQGDLGQVVDLLRGSSTTRSG